MKYKVLVICLLFISLSSSLLYESFHDTPTYDEPANIAAAYDYVYRNDYRIYPDNPPLIKLLAGLALFPIHANLNFPSTMLEYRDPSHFDLYKVGTKFLYRSDNDPRLITFLTRIPNILITLGLGVLLYFFAQSLFGGMAGLLALTLYALDPNIRGHGHILAFDIPLAFIMLLILYVTFSARSAHSSRWAYSNTPLLAILFSLGFLTKFTFIFFAIACWIGLILFGIIQKRTVAAISQVLIYALTSIATLWAFGLLTNYNMPSLNYDRVPIIASANEHLSDSFAWNMMRQLPVPYHYRVGIQTMYTHSLVSQPAMLLGEVHAKNDWFFYFPISFVLKTPIPTLLLILLAIIHSGKRLAESGKSASSISNNFFLTAFRFPLSAMFPFLLGAYFMLMMMIFSHINNVYRYLFPSLTLFILGASQIAGIQDTEYRNKKKSPFRYSIFYILYPLLLYLLITSIVSFPYDLSYTNEFTGIPPKGHLYLSDSEVDWGQDLERLALWLKDHNLQNEQITLSYLGTADPAWYGIHYKPLQFNDLNHLTGIVAISATNLYLGDWQVTSSPMYYKGSTVFAPLDSLRHTLPCAYVGKSIYIFKY